MEAMLRTPLVTAHERLGARMVPFSGWLMPLQYAGVTAEHLHTRAAAGLFDLSHMGRITLTGADVKDLLQRATTNDVERLEVGTAQYSLMCNAHGGVIEDLLVYRHERHWRLIVNATNRPRVLALLGRLSGDGDATIRDDTFDYALLGLQGPDAQAVLQQFTQSDLSTLGYYHARSDTLSFYPGERRRAERRRALAGDQKPVTERRAADRRQARLGYQRVPVTLSRTGYTGEDGFEIMVAAPDVHAVWEQLLVDPRVRPAGLGARDTLRLEAGMALYGHELREDVTPFEADLGRVVRLEKAGFVGRAALAALKEDPPARKLVGMLFGTGAVPRAEYRVNRAGEDVGEVASGTFSPTLRRPIATAYVRADAAAEGTEVTVTIRGTEAPGRVVPLPFVPHHTKAGGRG